MRPSHGLIALSLVLGLAACRSGSAPSSWHAPPSSARGALGRPLAAAPLVGGETDDNARLPEYLAYVAAYPHQDVPKLELSDRRVIELRGADGLPLWDHRVSVHGTGFTARTNSAGRFLLPSAALGLPPGHVPLLDVEGSGPIYAGQGDVASVPAVVRRSPERVAVDVALVVDTTGSMGDEVERLRTTLHSVVSQLHVHPLRPHVRIGGVAYRDVDDDYVVKPFDFTDDLQVVQRTLDGLSAGGGGDGPEAVQEALDAALHRLQWRGPGTVRLLFLVGDAPPHFERGVPYTQTMRTAVERGITIVPIACSGMDDTGEFVWRQLAAVTMGTFLFVSYGGGTDHHTGPYEENDLDSLMLRAVGRHLDALANARHDGQSPHVATGVPHPIAPGSPPPPLPGSRTGWGRSPWDFGIPGWSR